VIGSTEVRNRNETLRMNGYSGIRYKELSRARVFEVYFFEVFLGVDEHMCIISQILMCLLAAIWVTSLTLLFR